MKVHPCLFVNFDLDSTLNTAADLPTMPNVEYTLRGYNLLVGNPLASGHEADPGFDNVVFEAKYSGATTADLRYQVNLKFLIVCGATIELNLHQF
jgi:hypothetical protein